MGVYISDRAKRGKIQLISVVAEGKFFETVARHFYSILKLYFLSIN